MQSTRKSVFGTDDLSRKLQTLAALRLAAKREIGLGRAFGTATGCVTNITLTNGIAHTDNHCIFPLLRIVRYIFCERFAIVIVRIKRRRLRKLTRMSGEPDLRRGFAGNPAAQRRDSMDLKDACLIYSLWPGYLERDRTDLRAWAKRKEIDFHIVHSSGHASFADLHRMAQAVAPQRLLPIHTVHPERYASHYTNTEIAANGEWVAV